MTDPVVAARMAKMRAARKPRAPLTAEQRSERGRKGGSTPKRGRRPRGRDYDYETLFTWYFGLGRERSYKRLHAVAVEHGWKLSMLTLSARCSAKRFPARAEALDQQALAQVERRMIRQRVDREFDEMSSLERIVQATLSRVEEIVTDPEVMSGVKDLPNALALMAHALKASEALRELRSDGRRGTQVHVLAHLTPEQTVQHLQRFVGGRRLDLIEDAEAAAARAAKPVDAKEMAGGGDAGAGGPGRADGRGDPAGAERPAQDGAAGVAAAGEGAA